MTDKKVGKRRSVSGVFAALTLVVCCLAAGCNYGRMNDQESIRTYERKMPVMDKRSIPMSDGFEVLSHADPQKLRNPLPYTGPSIEQGRLAYSYFCIQCHGAGLDGNGTVGQSFVPLPANLVSDATFSQGDGELYAKVRLGFKRHPVLFPTVSADDSWAAIIYMRSVGKAR